MIVLELLKSKYMVLALAALLWGGEQALTQPKKAAPRNNKAQKVTAAARKAAAAAARANLGLYPGVSGSTQDAPAVLDPGGVPHYCGPFGNWAYSPLPKGPITGIVLASGGNGYTAPSVDISDVYGTGSGATASATIVGGVITSISIMGVGADYTAPVVIITDPTGTGAAAMANIGPGSLTGGIRKFVDSLPGLGAANANNLGQYLPVAVPDTTTYPGADYYEIELREYFEQLHSDLPPTKLRGYRQTNMGGTPIHYLGPTILAKRDRPVRVRFTNNLPTGEAGDLFIPVDTTVMGAGMGPLGMAAMPMNYTQNRTSLHLHGCFCPWISDGTPHQWTTPAGEMTSYPKGVSVYNVPDMPDGGPNPPQGVLTFYYNNQQSARLMFYHDHAFGITRLNVYAGMAAGYLLTDDVEQDLIAGTNVTGVNPGLQKVLPDLGIPLIIQDKTFVDAATIAAQDPTWNWGTGARDPITKKILAAVTGDLWYPHVYVPAQNPFDPSGANPFGRWHYGPWFWPPTLDLAHPPLPNPYYDPINAPWEPQEIPATPNPSMPGEAFMDTPLVNGTAYPYLEVDPKAYRFRILNAANDRFFNLQWYVADPLQPTEVTMVPAQTTPGFPADWPVDGREGGVPDPATMGPDWIQVGTEGGFLPAPVVVPNQPVTWNLNATTFNFGNVEKHSLLVGTAERVDVVVDFSAYAGKTLILYNDAPAAFPALDSRYDYYTGNPDQTDTGGAPPTQPGYGPNTRTIMQIRVSAAVPAPPYDPTLLDTLLPAAFKASQDTIIVPGAAYDKVYGGPFPADPYVRQHATSVTFATVSGLPNVIPIEPKAIQDEMGEAYDIEYGRMSGMLGLEVPTPTAATKGFVLYGFAAPPVDIVVDSVVPKVEPAYGDGTQIWRITHNGVDTHTIHFHLFNVQVINRVAWDGAIIPPDANELGWKETVRVNPLEHTIVAFRAVRPEAPFDIPNSVRPMDVTMPLGAPLTRAAGTQQPGQLFDPSGAPVIVTNKLVNFGHEYVYHCHLLAHEEMDMMHSVVFAVAPRSPSGLAAALQGAKATLNWTDNSLDETGFVVQKREGAAPQWTTLATLPANAGSGGQVVFKDPNNLKNKTQYTYRVYAINTVGDTTVYPAPSIGFPNKTLYSDPSNSLIVIR